MANRPTRKIRRALQQKGFRREQDSRHERYVLVDQDGRDTSVFTVISRGSRYRDYGDRLLSYMASELLLSRSQLLDLIDCPLDYSAYLKLVRQQREI
ncbi:MAG: hypothetical protein OXC13_00740 [Caldilineaceae bacterium]|nr:hypothetical protein [Caldilineaceae bacterium]